MSLCIICSKNQKLLNKLIKQNASLSAVASATVTRYHVVGNFLDKWLSLEGEGATTHIMTESDVIDYFDPPQIAGSWRHVTWPEMMGFCLEINLASSVKIN